MKTSFRQAISLGALVLFGLALGQSASAKDEYRKNEQIQTCVSAIGERADYSDADRVVHTVTRLRQRNYAELEIRVDTSVYGPEDVREYAASCVTHTLGDIVRLRVNSVED
jgi:hypothetical protein